MDPGDVLFFDANMLHRSDQNRSDNPRWSMICCYNAARNDPYKEAHHPRYTPLQKVPDSAIREAGMRRFSDSSSDVAWLKTEEDKSARSLETSLKASTSHPEELKHYLNLMTLEGLPPRSFEDIKTAGYDGVQFASPATQSDVRTCHRLGLEFAASGRINHFEKTNPSVERWAGEGFVCATLHVGWGLGGERLRSRPADRKLPNSINYLQVSSIPGDPPRDYPPGHVAHGRVRSANP